MVDANDDICLTQVTQYSSQHAKPWPGTQIQLQERGRHSGYSGCKGQGGGSGQNPRRSFESPVQIPKITKIKSWHSQVSEWKSTSSKSMSMMVLIPKIDVGEGLDAQNRCRWGFGCQKPMSVRVWVPKIDVGDGLNSQNRWRRGLIIFQSPKSMYQMTSGTLILAILGGPDLRKSRSTGGKIPIFDIDFDLGAQHKNQCTRSHLVHWKPMVWKPRHWSYFCAPKIKSMFNPQNHRFSMYQMRSGALIFMLSPQVKVNVEDMVFFRLWSDFFSNQDHQV